MSTSPPGASFMSQRPDAGFSWVMRSRISRTSRARTAASRGWRKVISIASATSLAKAGSLDQTTLARVRAMNSQVSASVA